MKETRILLTETTFTNLCKSGYFVHRSEMGGSIDIRITKADMKVITSGKILEKDLGDEMIKIALQDIGLELIREIVRRSPVYSDMYYEI
jgi:hypothetical protein